MRFHAFCKISVLFCIIFIGTAACAAKPELFLTEPVYKFEPVIEGIELTHDFVIQNLGEEPLNILDVKTS
jgi:hypothetical protein